MKLNTGDIVQGPQRTDGGETIFRMIIKVRKTGYSWVYPDIINQHFRSEDSNDPFFVHQWVKVDDPQKVELDILRRVGMEAVELRGENGTLREAFASIRRHIGVPTQFLFLDHDGRGSALMVIDEIITAALKDTAKEK